jgi:hypothetical protein
MQIILVYVSLRKVICLRLLFFGNIFLAFKTPEECFLDEAPTTKFEWGSINPREYVSKLTKGNANETYHKNVNLKS